jgi:hypothetical protein
MPGFILVNGIIIPAKTIVITGTIIVMGRRINIGLILAIVIVVQEGHLTANTAGKTILPIAARQELTMRVVEVSYGGGNAKNPATPKNVTN